MVRSQAKRRTKRRTKRNTKRNTRRNTKRNTKRQNGGMESLLVEKGPQRINLLSDSEEYDDVPSRPWHSRRFNPQHIDVDMDLLRGISSSSEDGLTSLPSPTPNEVGYIHPELGSPDEDIPLHFNTPLARVKNFRLAIYKNKHDDGIIKIDNQIEGLNFGVFCGGNQHGPLPMITTAGPGGRITFGDPQEVILSRFVSQKCRVRDALGNRILTLRATNSMSGGEEPAYDLTFNIPESDENGTYVIYQK